MRERERENGTEVNGRREEVEVYRKEIYSGDEGNSLLSGRALGRHPGWNFVPAAIVHGDILLGLGLLIGSCPLLSATRGGSWLLVGRL